MNYHAAKPEPVDAVIVGCGASGATAAKVLSEAGFKVVGLDRGPWLKPEDYSGDELKYVNRNFLWPDPTLKPRTVREDEDSPTELFPFSPLPQLVGGGTVHWAGWLPRPMPSDFMQRTLHGDLPDANLADWPFLYDHLEPYLSKVEWEFGCTGLDGADGLQGITEALAAGFGAVKLGGLGRYDPGSPDDGAADLLRRARERAGGGIQLMADAGMGWTDPARVLALCEEVADLGLVWLEEPLPSDDLDGYAWLTQRSPVPISGGEHEFTARAFAELMDRGCHRIYQPDVCWCGGLTQLVEIYRLARDHGVRVCPHRGSEVWGLHAIAALDPEPLAESGRPWMEWVGGRELRDGRARWTGGPGFGVELPV